MVLTDAHEAWCLECPDFAILSAFAAPRSESLKLCIGQQRLQQRRKLRTPGQKQPHALEWRETARGVLPLLPRARQLSKLHPLVFGEK